MPISLSFENHTAAVGRQSEAQGVADDRADENTAVGSGVASGGESHYVPIDVPEEEAQAQRVVKTPDMPTAAEMAEHRANGHMPYRSWCPDCVDGFGREWAHRAHGRAEDRLIPPVSCDDFSVP